MLADVEAGRIVVVCAPLTETTEMLFPEMTRFSVYVPGATNTVSPSTAALIPA